MANEKNSLEVSGGGTAMTVFIVFLILKLTHVIGWSWWWVTAPLWMSTGIGIAFLLLALLFVVIATVLEN